MNRIEPWSHSAISQALEVETPESGSRKSGGVHHHAVFTPMHYEPNYAYPLVVWLHSDGCDERQLHQVMPEVSLRNYVAVGPRAPSRLTGARYAWTDETFSVAEQAVFDSIESAMQRFHIARHRVFLAGYASGGTMAFRIALSNPRIFAGVVSLCGPFPLGQAPLTQLEEIRELPFMIAQGRDSRAYPIERSCEELRVFHVAGLCADLRQYPCGDELDTLMLRDTDAWIMEQVTGVPASNNEVVESPFSADYDQLN